MDRLLKITNGACCDNKWCTLRQQMVQITTTNGASMENIKHVDGRVFLLYNVFSRRYGKEGGFYENQAEDLFGGTGQARREKQ